MKLLFTGDVNFQGKEGLTAEESEKIISQVQPYLDNVDFRIVNLECPLGDKNKYEPILKAGPNLICNERNLPFLKAFNTDVVTLANNHIGDYGEEAVKNTFKILKENNIMFSGAGENINEAYKACRLQKDDIKVSIISVCENEFGMATENNYGSAGYNPRLLLNQIKEEKKFTDYVIVVFHGGNEFNPLPNPDTVDRYRFICDMGADAVIGGHTHCPQGYEVYNGKPIVYSMGNLLFKSSKERNENDPWYYGYMSILEITDVITLKTVPYKFNIEATQIIILGNEISEYIDKLSNIIQKPDLLKNYFKGWSYLHQWVPWLEEGNFDCLDIARCEAHYSQMKQILKIYAYNDLAEAKYWAEKIKELSVIPV